MLQEDIARLKQDLSEARLAHAASAAQSVTADTGSQKRVNGMPPVTTRQFFKPWVAHAYPDIKTWMDDPSWDVSRVPHIVLGEFAKWEINYQRIQNAITRSQREIDSNTRETLERQGKDSVSNINGMGPKKGWVPCDVAWIFEAVESGNLDIKKRPASDIEEIPDDEMPNGKKQKTSVSITGPYLLPAGEQGLESIEVCTDDLGMFDYDLIRNDFADFLNRNNRIEEARVLPCVYGTEDPDVLWELQRYFKAINIKGPTNFPRFPSFNDYVKAVRQGYVEC